MRQPNLRLALLASCLLACPLSAAEKAPARLPKPGTVVVDRDRGEVILSATVQTPRGKPCIDDWGQRIQAFVGCARAAGGDAKMAGYFVFLVDVPTEDVYQALRDLGAKPRVHYSMQEGRKHSGLKTATKAEDFLQGDPVVLSLIWQQGERWIERPLAWVRNRLRGRALYE